MPISVIDEELEATSLGTQIAAHCVDLPVGEASPVVRLHQVSYSFQAHKETGRAVAANRLAGIAGFAPGDVPRARLAGRRRRDAPRASRSAITNVPGPQSPLYAAGARMLETYPVHPLLPGHALSIGVTSYDGGVFYGITADRDMLPDVDVLGQCVTEALDELVDTASGARPKVPRGRKKAAPKKATPTHERPRLRPGHLHRSPAWSPSARRSATVPRARGHAALDESWPEATTRPGSTPR